MTFANNHALSRRRLPRRAIFKLTGGAGAGAALLAFSACSSKNEGANATSTAATTPVPSGTTAATSATPANPPRNEIRSAGGVLKTTLTIAPAMVSYGNTTRWALTVNGQTPGPTLVAKAGDHLTIILENKTGHSTNLHTHGLGVSPTGNADNPFIEIENGKSHTYEIDIPASHPGGTFWYHPHFHHHVAEQLFAGFFGLIVVEDAVDTLPEIAGATQRSILLHDTRTGTTESQVLSASQMAMRDGREGEVFVSGAKQPVFSGEVGRLERWRVLNASPSRFYRLSMEGHQLYLIATDGNRLAAPTPVDELTLVPGERVELLIQHKTAGKFALKSLAVSRGAMSASSDFTLATFDVAGGGTAPALPSRIAAFESLANVKPSLTREVVFAMQGQMGGARFLIDGKQFDSNRIDVKVTKGTTEDWLIRNTSPMDHPFHLHVWPFQVIEPAPNAKNPAGWKDVVNIPANSSVRVRIPFVGITGKTVFHCHILDHEDMGMMAIIEVS